MPKNHPLVKSFSTLLAAALALGPTPAWAQAVVGRSVAAPAVSAIPGAAGAAISGLSARPGLAPTLAAPSLTSPVLPSALSAMPTAKALSAAPAAAAVNGVSEAQPGSVGLSVVAAAAPAAVVRNGQVTGSLSAAPAAAESAPAPIKEAAPTRGPLARVFKAVTSSLSFGRLDRLFEGRGGAVSFRPEDEGRQQTDGVRLDPTPTQPRRTEVPGVSWDKVQMPGQAKRPNLLARVFGAKNVSALELTGNPTDAAGVEAALRRLVAEDRGEFGGIAPAQLRTVMATKVAGQAGLSDTYYVNFIQLHNGVEVEGTFLGFTVKVVAGKPVVIGSSANLYPWLNVDTFGRLDDRAIVERAAVRLGNPTASASDFNDQGVKVMHLGGQWRAARLMLSKNNIMAAVDINTGETFAWDVRHKMTVSGDAQGRGIADGPIEQGVPSPLALAHVEIKASNGKSYFADAEGKFKVEGEGDAPVQLTVRLSGRFAYVEDQEHKDLVVTVTAKPGEELRVVFNPEGKEENFLAQVNAYVHTTAVHEFLVNNGINIAALDKPMLVKTNIDDECNAYYTPYNPSLNFFKSSSRCANSSYNDVSQHEYGHALDDAAHHGIPNGGLSEAIGDMLAMYLTKQPIIGRGFLKGSTPDYIRNGENKYQYRSRDEVHDQGQAGMGFAWKLRKALIAALGELEGEAVARALILPAILASNRDIPAFINSVLMRDVNDQGVAPHFEQIKAAAAAHGIKVAAPRAGMPGPTGGYVEAEGWWDNITSAWTSAAQYMVHR